jgi:thiamine transporter ThiT
MASKDSFWRGVLQNALGSLLAGLVLLGIGRAWVLHNFDSVLGTLKTGLAQVQALQNRLDQIGAPQAPPSDRGR